MPRLLDADDYVAVVLVAALHLQTQDGSTVSANRHLRLERETGAETDRDKRGVLGCCFVDAKNMLLHNPCPQKEPPRKRRSVGTCAPSWAVIQPLYESYCSHGCSESCCS